jgi:hypothetical protein
MVARSTVSRYVLSTRAVHLPEHEDGGVSDHSRVRDMIGDQRIQVGLPHAGKTIEITVESDTYRITVEPGITVTAPRYPAAQGL